MDSCLKRMSCRILILIQFIQLLFFCILLTCVTSKEFFVKSDQVEQLVITSDGFHRIYAHGGENDASYMLQLHSQMFNMTLCNSPLIAYDSCTHGTNIGMYSVTDFAHGNPTLLWHVRVNSTNDETLVLAYLHRLVNEDPFPGGCNQVFNIENDPSVKLTYHSHHVHLLFQWANEFSTPMKGCDSHDLQEDLEYVIFVYFLDVLDLGQQTYLDGMSRMFSVHDILTHGQKVTTLENSATSKPEVSVASEPSRGAIFSILAKSKSTGLYSPYVTVMSYSCHLELGDCVTEISVGEIIIAVLCFLIGVYMLFLGHRWFHISQFVFGYLLTFILVYILMHMAYTVHRSVVIVIAGCVGVIGATICLLFWYRFFFPIVSVLVLGLCAGYLVAATIFFTPFGNLQWWDSNENYGLSFVCLILMYAVLLMAFTKFLSILSCALVGSYMTLMVFAIPTSSSLRLIYLYSEYRQTEPDFKSATLVAPMEPADIALLTAWPILLIVGLIFQYYRERDRPPFERPDSSWKRDLQLCSCSSPTSRHVEQSSDSDSEATSADSPDGNERQPLLPSSASQAPSSHPSIHPSRIPFYQSVQDPQESPNQK